MARPCPSCGTGIATRSARWCNSCGASLTGPAPTSDGVPVQRRVTRGPGVGAAVSLSVLLAVGVAVLGWGDRSADAPPAPATPPAAGEVELELDPDLDDLGADERAVEPGSAAVVGPEDWSAADGSLGRSRPTCDVEGCALWRGTLLGTGPVAVDERLAVAARDALLVAVDIDTGQLRWRVTRPLLDREVHALHVDERVVAVANGRTVTALDPRTGTVRGTSTPLPFVVRGFARFDGQLVAMGRGADEMVVAGLDDRAQVRFVRAGRVDALSADATTPLLVEHDDAIRRLDATTGRDRWTVPLDGRVRDGLTLLERSDGRIEVLEPRTGVPLLTQVVPGAVAAGVRSGVLVVVTPDELLLVGRDGTAIGEVAGFNVNRTVVTAAGIRVTVVEVPTGGTDPRVAVRQVLGAAAGLPGPSQVYDVPGTNVLRAEAGTVGREVGATRRRDGLLVASHRNAWVAPPGLDAAVPVDVPVGERVRYVDGLAVRLLADGLDLGGAGGQIGVRGAWEVLSLDPLLVRGTEGTLRLDRALLDG